MNEIQKLKEMQASLQVFYQKINNIHWNIKGLEFFEIHAQSDKLKDDVLNFVDEIAEKVVMKGEVALGSYTEVLEASKITELTSQIFDYKQVLKVLVNDLKILLQLAESFEWSARVQPIFDEVLLSLDKWLWQFDAMSK
ncbi:Dps family protein [Mycoplasma sp. 6243]|uniref:Dps family protein n=1 Tax=Mycoplasma sp. 6243 TaxID=3440865 RepID=UPI003EB753A1